MTQESKTKSKQQEQELVLSVLRASVVNRVFRTMSENV